MTTIYTVGHSNHEIEDFLALLDRHGIQLLIDVRSSPYSRYVPQANRQALARTLEAHQLHVLLSAGDPDAAQVPPAWRRVNVAS